MIDDAAASKKRYRIYRGEPGQNIETRDINLKKDLCQGRASEGFLSDRLRAKSFPQVPLSPGSSCRAPNCRCPGPPKEHLLAGRDESRPKRDGGETIYPSKLSFSAAEMVSMLRRQKLYQSFRASTEPNPLLQGRRSRLAIRLRLLWLNFLLIPTRIHYMLRRTNRGPYGKPIITSRGEDQQRSWPS